MPSAARLEKKQALADRIFDMLDNYSAGFIVHADNVSSKQFMDVRRGIRENSVVLMGKNTMVRRAFRVYAEKNNSPFWLEVAKLLVGNVGVVFTKGELTDVKDIIAKFKVGAPAKAGSIAPVDVTIPAGGTGLDPSQTSFFQALSIPTKINRGAVEIVTDVKVITEGDKVGASEAALLAKLNIKPFAYGLVFQHVFEKGTIYSPAVLDITDDDLTASFTAALNRVTSVALETGIPTMSSVPHSIINAYKKVLSVSIATDYTFPLADKVKEMIANPGAFAAAAPAAATEAKEEAKEESEEESDDDMGFSLFD
jgi:large subunit ribosomal protein LP0